ncbi:MAG: phage tail protein [Omnitrophica bacterium]|nr:phage tail protein [Candidatus Omnitrophota bacterium]
MAIKYNKTLTGQQITDELHNNLGNDFYSLDHDTFWGGNDFDIWTGAGATGIHLIEDTHYTLHDEDTTLTTESGSTVYTTLKIIDPTYQAVDLYFTYKTIGDYNEAEDINDLAANIAANTPAGVILLFGGAAAPTGFLLSDGSSLLRASYSELFTAIGTAYGTAAGTHFNIPDLRGQFPRGVDGGAGVDPDAAGRTALQAGGNVGDNVGSKQLSLANSLNQVETKDSGGGSLGVRTIPDTGWSTYQYTATYYSAGGWRSIRFSKKGGETRPVNVYVNYIIKY